VKGLQFMLEHKLLTFFNVFLTAHPCIILQINPTRCKVLPNIFISLLCMFRANVCHHQEKITVFMRHWYLSFCVGGVWSADQTPPIQSDKYQCRIGTVIFYWLRAHGWPQHVEKWNKYTKQKCAPSWIYLQ